MRTKKVAHHEIISDPESSVVVVITSIDLAVAVRLRLVTSLAILRDLNRGQFLDVTLTQLRGERKPLHIARTIFSNFNIIDRVVLVKVEITNPRITGVDLLFKFGGIFHRLQKCRHRLEVQTISRLRGHRHVDILVHVIAARYKQMGPREEGKKGENFFHIIM
jgi:hypothetical protein